MIPQPGPFRSVHTFTINKQNSKKIIRQDYLQTTHRNQNVKNKRAQRRGKGGVAEAKLIYESFSLGNKFQSCKKYVPIVRFV